MVRPSPRPELAELESRLQKTILTAMLGMTAIFGTLVVALKLFG
jgi:hypothetical protein